jgi:putative SOS response-associated peptidase YedK
MCGRFLAVRSAAELAQLFRVDEISPAASTLGPRYNIGPGAPAAIIFDAPPPPQTPTSRADTASWADGPADRTERTRHLELARFGLTPSWLRSGRVPAKLVFNARAETAAEKVSFRDALSTRRCIIPADGFYEWGDDARVVASRSRSGATGSGSPNPGSQDPGSQDPGSQDRLPAERQLFGVPERGDRTGSRGERGPGVSGPGVSGPGVSGPRVSGPRVSGHGVSGRARVPWCFRAAGQDTLVLAGLYERTRPGLAGSGRPVSSLGGTERGADTDLSCVILTTRPTAEVARVHDRMPLLLSGDDVELWLSGEPFDSTRLDQIAARNASITLISYRVSTAVGSSRAEGPELGQPID